MSHVSLRGVCLMEGKRDGERLTCLFFFKTSMTSRYCFRIHQQIPELGCLYCCLPCCGLTDAVAFAVGRKSVVQQVHTRKLVKKNKIKKIRSKR